MNSRIMPPDLSAFTRSRLPRRPSEEADTVDVRALLAMVWRRRWMILGAMLGLGLLAWAITGQLTPVYTAQSKVMLDPRKAQIVNKEEVVQALDLSEQVVNGEAAVLRSNVLIAQVVDRLGFETLAPLAAPPEGVDLAAAPEAVRDRHRETLVWKIRRDLSVYREGESYVIGIRMESVSPTLSALLANTLAEMYIEAQLDATRSTTEQATVMLAERVESLRAEVEAAEDAIATFRAQSLLSDGGSLDTASRQLSDLNAELIQARGDRVTAEARYNQLHSVREREGLEAVAALVTSPLVERLMSERIELDRQEAVWSERYGTDHPERVRIAAELGRLEDDLGEEVDRIIAQRRNELEIARLREETLADGIAGLESRVLAISKSALGLRQLEREAEATRRTYESLLARLTETRTLERLQQPDAKLIERATVPGAPSAPRPKLMGVIGAMLGGALGLGLAFFLEMTSQTFRSAREIEAETQLPVLAHLPVQPWTTLMGAAEALRDEPYSLYGERVRHLRTALLLRDGHEASRAILLLSSAPDEGKTTTAVALAQMSAMAGKSVVLIDGDLRRSSLQRAFGWEMEEDFADFIRGDCSLDRAIYTDPDFGFDFLAARGPHPDVADRLSTTWLNRVVAELKRVYDVVLIDAPALLAVSDALVLAQVADTRIYLVRWDKTPRSAVRDGLDALEEMGLGVTGAVLTMVDPERSPDAYGEGYSYAPRPKRPAATRVLTLPPPSDPTA